MKKFLKTQWPAIVASILISVVIAVAIITINNNLDAVIYTFKR